MAEDYPDPRKISLDDAHRMRDLSRANLEAMEQLEGAPDDPGSRRRFVLGLLKKAPLSGDLYTELAVLENDLGRRLDLYDRAVHAGAAEIGGPIDGDAFWGRIETRPYMRARLGLAMTLEELGRHDEAIGHYRALLDLNPRDNQGIRSFLLPLLLDLERWEEADALLRRFEEFHDAEVLYTCVLMSYRRDGSAGHSSAFLWRALSANVFVPEALDRPMIFRTMGDTVRVGGPDEASLYADRYQRVWRANPKALDWMIWEARRRISRAIRWAGAKAVPELGEFL